MTGIRRTLLLAGTLLAVMVGPASPPPPASPTRRRSAHPVATVAVAPPTSVTVSALSCDPLLGANFTVTWARSDTAKVTGYRVQVQLGNGKPVVLGQTAAGTTTFDGNLSDASMNQQPRVTVVTLTGYSWTANSARTEILTCSVTGSPVPRIRRPAGIPRRARSGSPAS